MTKCKVSSKFYFVFIFIIVIGICFRFTNLDGKFYWQDEAYTSLMLSGHSPTEIKKEITDKIIRVQDLQKYQHISSDKSVFDTVKVLAQNDPQHPPLWYFLTRLWIGIVGDSVANIRVVSVFLSLLALPLTYWLCLELFNSAITGFIGTVIVAISPFHILYAQEAREYSLWTVTILFSSTVMLRAIKRNTVKSWVLYSLTVSLALYSYLLNLLVIFAQGVYIFIINKFEFSKTTLSFCIASFVGFLTFIPWLVYLDQIDAAGWTSAEMPFLTLVKFWILNFGRIFIDTDFGIKNPLSYLILPLFCLAAYSIYFLCKNTTRSSWLFILVLIATNTLPLLLPDIFVGGRKSGIARFLTPLYLGIQISISYLIASKVNLKYFNKKHMNLWNFLLIIIIGLGIFSGFRISTRDYPWNKSVGEDFFNMAQIINSSPNPVLVSDSSKVVRLAELLSFSHLLNSNVRIQGLLEPDSLNVSDQFSDSFIIQSSENIKYKIEQVKPYSINIVYQGTYKQLWKIEK